MEYFVDNEILSYRPTGPVLRGGNVVLLNYADDLTQSNSWAERGYTVEPLFEQALYSDFQKSTRELLVSRWRKSGLDIEDSFSISGYHTIASDKSKHLSAIEYTRLLSVEDFPIPISNLESRVSEILKLKVIVKNPFDNQSAFHFRVIRPNSGDNNPLHRDVWLPDYKDCINIYIPVAGSNERSSLIISPGSHLWPESDIERTQAGAELVGLKFNVPAVTRLFTEAKFVRPNPGANEVLVFSPYLIHGGSSNLNENLTRISIEVRMWRK